MTIDNEIIRRLAYAARVEYVALLQYQRDKLLAIRKGKR